MTNRRGAFVARRKACGFSQESFAHTLGVELTTAGRWERGQVTVVHLLETERVADELVRANPNARALIQDLLSRGHRRIVPGLRGLAIRTGVAA